MASYAVDLENGAVNAALVPPSDVTNGTGTAADLNNGSASVNAVLNVGTATGSATVGIQETDDSTNGPWTTLGTLTIAGGGAGTNTLQVKRLLRTKRYLRSNVSGITTDCYFSLTVHDQKEYVYGSGDSNSGVDRSPSS